MKPKPIAVLCSDLHLTLTPPSCRDISQEGWMELQAHYLKQLRDTAGDLPVICAGDIFDRWNASPELINFALRELPNGMYCVPGQHDLPNHQLGQMGRSGYGVLKQTGKILDLSGKRLHIFQEDEIIPNAPEVRVYGCGWGQGLEDDELEEFDGVSVAVIHRYCWLNDNTRFPGAPPEAKATALKKELSPFDVAVFGDNHISFLATVGNCKVFNCGGFIRRKSDEMLYQPSIGILFDNGDVEVRHLNTCRDKFHKGKIEDKETPFDLRSFIKELESLGEHGLDFRQTVKEHLESQDLPKQTKQLILEALETR